MQGVLAANKGAKMEIYLLLPIAAIVIGIVRLLMS